jgi:HSP20 family protein
MSTPRWDPFDEILAIRESIDRLMKDVFARAPHAHQSTGWQPAVEIFEASDRIVIRFEAPGADPDSIEVRAEAQRLTVRGRAPGAPVPAASYHVRELRYGPFERSIQLPPGLAVDDATAAYRHGILEVRIPKARSAGPHSVPIDSVE